MKIRKQSLKLSLADYKKTAVLTENSGTEKYYD